MTTSGKRILFVSSPGYGNFFPIVPLAWAMRAAGQHVLVATCGEAVDAAGRAGLPVWDVAPGAGIPSSISLRSEFRFAPGGLPGENAPAAASGKRILTELAEEMMEGLYIAAQKYRPQAIIFTPAAGAAPIVAAKLQIPAIFLGVGLAQTPKLMYETTYQSIGSACDCLGVTSLPPCSAWLDVAPPSLRSAPSDGWLMQYVPYNGGGRIHTKSVSTQQRSLVAVTLGTVVPVVAGTDIWRSFIATAGSIDADFIIAHASAEFAVPDGLPPNVHATPWVAFDSLFAHCCAVIHHGGSGTMLTALRAGLPQLILPFGADQFYNAAALGRRGGAIVATDRITDREQLEALMGDETLRDAAQEVSREMAAPPSPADLVSRILALAPE